MPMRNDMPLSLSPQTTYHLGNIRQVTMDDGSKKGEVIQRMNYYPFGAEFCDNSSKSYVQNHKYNGKEFDHMHGLNTYDYGARQYNPILARWDRTDPLCEKYYSTSPYVYCMNNPIRFIDPDGMDVLITGNQINEALKQLQDIVGKCITLTCNDNNQLCYSINKDEKMNKNAKKVMEIIDNCDIIVNLQTTNEKKTSTGNHFVGGAFMGNEVVKDENGNVQYVNAFQEINPSVLAKADSNSKSGTFIMHELTEAYAGAQISAKKGVSSPNSNENNSVYQKAHNAASPQPEVRRTIYDYRNRVMTTPPSTPSDMAKVGRIEYSVGYGKKKTIIQTCP